ncbi:hypothetical protein B0A48_00567 [Cryoendolithus antarcticus]|uniref:TAFII28-like protein domain-containing protein n=1 Tax=Cryoendolithus antarcticus TaxID=1507870 RepID=A0A1V8TV47_9PEZI|nr:hypothetical protein B0A48_00567 [Cryoendolithus antarcticus]
MASPPPPSSSPPALGGLTLPRQRPALTLPTASALASRKPPTTSTATLSSHPLRQTSFPPEGQTSPRYSPSVTPDFSDSEITSAISGPTTTSTGKLKRKRGEKRKLGRPRKEGSLLPDPELRSSPSHPPPPQDDPSSDSDASADDPLASRSHLDAAYRQQQSDQKSMLALMPEWQRGQYAQWHAFKLNKADVRKLVNQTLSQSVPANVVNVVSSYLKIFAGQVVEGAREVQGEWMLEEGLRKKRRTGDGEGEVAGVKKEGGESAEGNGELLLGSDDTQPDSEGTIEGQHAGGQNDLPDAALGWSREVDELDRGPLLADHLREAVRRMKKSRAGGSVGFTGLSLEGREVAAPRMGGRRLFR